MKKHLSLILFICLLLALLGWWIQCKFCCVPKPEVCKGYVDMQVKSKDGEMRTVHVSYRCDEIILRGDHQPTYDYLISQGYRTIDSCSCNPTMRLMRASIGANAVGIVENPPATTKDSSMILNYVFPAEPFKGFDSIALNPDYARNPMEGGGVGTVKVGVIDTGVDFDHSDLLDFLWLNDKKNRAAPPIR